MKTEGKIYICRHGETEWSKSGQHTGLTDVPLTDAGLHQAKLLGKRLMGYHFAKVISSPSQRAAVTCELAGFDDRMEIWQDCAEWDYGKYEGRTSKEIHEEDPTWNIFDSGGPGGESVAAATARADRVLTKLLPVVGPILIFSSGHISRLLATRWLGLGATCGKFFVLSPASLSILGHERETKALLLWNETSFLA